MLLKLREKTSGWIAGTIVGILIIPFAFFGVTDYFSASADTWVAKVGDAEISQQDYQQRFEEYRAQMRQMLGERYDGRMLENPETRKALLDRMIDEELLRQSAAAQGAIVPPAVLQKEIAAIPAFQIGGNFSAEQYRLLLANQNMSPRDFEQRILRDLQVRAIPQQIEASAFATANDVERYVALRDQRRDLRYVVLEAPPAAEEELVEADVVAFYERNSARFMSEEQVTIEYVELDGTKLEIPTVADEETLQRRYEDASSRFVEPEQRLASHILVKTDADADADAQRVAQAKAQELVEKARAADSDFAGLARESSEDAGSKAGGGDLGWLERGLTDPAFETALFALDPGAISDPVKSADGWHVIQLREVRAEKRKAFADVRVELEREFLETERERRFSDLSGQLIDALYRDPTTLDGAAKEIGVPLQTLGPVGRLGGADAVSSNPRVIEAAFSPAALKERTVSEALELGDAKLLALRVTEHIPSAAIPLADIRPQVEVELRQEQRSEKAAGKAKSLLAQLQGGEGLDALATGLELEVQEALDVGRTGATVEPAIISAAFTLKHPTEAGGVASTHIALGGDRHALLQVAAVRAADTSSLDAEQRLALRDQLAQANGGAEAQAYVAALRKQFKVELAPERVL
jgi:peptidyl-prolyl cis-trans isomerase D